MTPDRWQELKRLFEIASGLNRSEWEPFIFRSCADDRELAELLRDLLEQSDSATELPPLPRPPIGDTARQFYTFRTGQVVMSRFEIASFLGRGGMGEVYKAHDRELDEDVALKTIRLDAGDPDAMLQRMRYEVRRSRRIVHPNVCRVYDLFAESREDGVVTPFLTMQLLEGPTLADVLDEAGRLTEAQALPLAKQIASALGAAHSAGIIHRDLKPGNIILVNGDCRRAVVTDFGIAAEVPGLDAHRVTGRTLIGTPPYMAPEQFSGVASPASDMYAFGVLMFRAITGSVPAQMHSDPGGSSVPPLRNVLHQHSQDLSEQWRTVIRRCLEVQPERRFKSAAELLAALEHISRGGLPGQPPTRRLAIIGSLTSAAIAGWYVLWRNHWSGRDSVRLLILPLTDATNTPDGTLIADGFADGLIDLLGRQQRVRVIAHHSAFHYKGRSIDAALFHRELGVSNFVSGGVEIQDDRIRVSVTLWSAPDGRRIWAREYVTSPRSIVTLQRELSGTLMAVLTNQRDSTPPAKAGPPVDFDTYKLYLKGRYHWTLRTEAGFRQAVECFREVVAVDPSYKRAYCGLADAYTLLGLYGFAPPRDVMPAAKAAAEHALGLDNMLGEAHTSLGLIKAVYDWEWDAARGHLETAVALDPSYVTALDWYGFYLAWTDQPQKAREQNERSQLLDPLSIAMITHAGWFAFWNRDYKRAENSFRHAMALNPDFIPDQLYAPLALTYAQQSRFKEALATIEAGQKRDAVSLLADAARIYALAGHRDKALELLTEIERGPTGRFSGATIAMAYEALGDKEKAFFWLNRGLMDRSSEMAFIKVDPRLGRIRSDPRFQQVLRQVHFSS